MLTPKTKLEGTLHGARQSQSRIPKKLNILCAEFNFYPGFLEAKTGECVGRPSDLPRPRGFIEIVYFVKSADKSIRIGAAPVVLLYFPPQLLNFRIVLG